MRTEIVTTYIVCDLCGHASDVFHERAFPHSPRFLHVGPLDFCHHCQWVGRCQSCGDFMGGATGRPRDYCYAGNCLDCWRKAMKLPRGVCQHSNYLNAQYAPCQLDPYGGHHCREMPRHQGRHECSCGYKWGAARGGDHE